MQSNMTIGMPSELADKLGALAKKLKVSRNSLLVEGVNLVLAKYSKSEKED
jgi:predicted transcriptional regulator